MIEDETIDRLADIVGDTLKAELSKRDGRIAELENRIKQLESGWSSASADRVMGRLDLHDAKNEAIRLKLDELQRQADANKRHTQNLESKIAKLESAASLKPFPGMK
jgi:predicted  nucleic acid-binding Zn-ribbon protein